MTFEKNTIEGEAINIDDIAARSETVEIDPAEEKKLVRKIDWKLMPVLCFTYALQYYDKAILSQAAVFGLREDLQLTNGLRYSWVSLIFYFGYLIGTYPLSFLAQKYPPRIICAIICLLWALVIICTPAAGSYGGLLANRFLLGVTEAGVSPIFMLVVGMWYTHPEQVLRSSFWYSFSGGSLVISPLINYGLGHISGAGLHPWQYMYLIAGATTFLWGIALWWLFPETPRHASGFDEHERSLLLERIKANNAGSENHDFKLHHVREALSDYQFWGLILLSITTCTGGGVINTFSSIVFNGMGFTNFQSLLLNLPNGGMAFLCILGSGYIGRMVPNSRLYIVAASSFPVILGCALLWKLPDSMRGGRIVGFYLINCFSSGWVQCIGLGTSNVAGHTKKSVYAAGTFVGYSVGNIVGPLVFDAKYAPRYKESFIGIMVCFSVSFIVSLCLRALLARENTKRQSKYGDPELSHGLEDLTDGENMSFRYNL